MVSTKIDTVVLAISCFNPASIINLDNSQALISLRLLRRNFFPRHNFFRRLPVVQEVVLRPLLWQLVMNRIERLSWWSGGASRRRRKAVVNSCPICFVIGREERTTSIVSHLSLPEEKTSCRRKIAGREQFVHRCSPLDRHLFAAARFLGLVRSCCFAVSEKNRCHFI
nr:hypothetical protein Iba_chr14aCG7850 [Ipomoea batatas]